MPEIVLSASMFIPQVVYKQGRALLFLAIIWFFMANINKRGRTSFSTIFYLIIGGGFFAASIICFISVFFEASYTTRIAIFVMITLAVVIIAFIIAYSIIKEENSQKGRTDSLKEDEFDKERGECDGFK